jgi:energy-coupling factor transporter transmembrane protein EcfT
MLLLPLLPLVTLTQGGFLGFGIMWAVTVAAFLFAQSKRKAAYIFAAPAVFFIGLSLFVNYMAARDDLRQLVWYEQASLGDRLQRIADVFVNFELLDLSNSRHREAIDRRLNQNFLVGAAAARLESGQVEYASGATLGNMIVALVPRAIWPDKPAVGGGGNVVADFTGIEFAEGTSVGAGQVLEFYVNFGTWGVIGGFLVFGCLIGRMDLLAMRYLRQGQQTRFLLWFIMGLALLNPGGNLQEVVVTVVGCAVTAHGLGYLLKRYNRSSTRDVFRTIAGRSGG